MIILDQSMDDIMDHYVLEMVHLLKCHIYV